jgi:hypothetical protein
MGNTQNKILVAEPKGSTPLILKPAFGYDPEPVPSILTITITSIFI